MRFPLRHKIMPDGLESTSWWLAIVDADGHVVAATDDMVRGNELVRLANWAHEEQAKKC